MLKNKWRSAQGYTLSETLVVLSLFIMLSALGLNLYPRFVKGMENSMFIGQLQEDIFYAQQYAISHEAYVTFHADNNEGRYIVYTSYENEVILKRKMPEGAYFSTRTLEGYTFQFNQFGNAAKAGTMILNTTQGNYRFVLNIGKGRFRFEQL